MAKMFEFVLTPAAQAVAPEGVTAKAQDELIEIQDGGWNGDTRKGFFHCFEMGAHEYILVPRSDGKMVLDLCVFEEMDTLDKGPFAGKKVMMPRPYSTNEFPASALDQAYAEILEGEGDESDPD